MKGFFRSLFLAAAVTSLPAAAADSVPNPVLTDLAVELHVKLGPTEEMGQAPDGKRSIYPIVGGTVAGPAIKGQVVPGGGDFFVDRPDGAGVVDALYRIKTDDGTVIILHNKGLFYFTESGKQKLAAGQKTGPADEYCRTVPEFIAPAGKYDWLNKSIFVGTITDGAPDEVIIRIYRVH